MSDLHKEIADLRKTAQDQLKAIRSGSATNYKAATQTRREIARKLTQLNQETKEGEKE